MNRITLRYPFENDGIITIEVESDYALSKEAWQELNALARTLTGNNDPLWDNAREMAREARKAK